MRTRKYDRPGRPRLAGVGAVQASMTVLSSDWEQFKLHCAMRGTNASAEVRKFIARELRKSRAGR